LRGDDLGAFQRVEVVDGQVDRTGSGGLGGQLNQPRQRFARRSHLLERHDLALDHLQQRLDRERGREQRGRRPDAPAPAQVLERVDVEQRAGLVDGVRGRPLHLRSARPVARRPRRGEDREAERHRRRAGVDDADDAVTEVLCRQRRRLPGSGQRCGQVDGHDVARAVVQTSLVGSGEVGRRRTRGGDVRLCAQRFRDLVRRHVDTVAGGPAVDVDAQRDDADAELGDERRREVRRRVRDDRDVFGHAPASLSRRRSSPVARAR